jgi:hypothetical protein
MDLVFRPHLIRSGPPTMLAIKLLRGQQVLDSPSPYIHTFLLRGATVFADRKHDDRRGITDRGEGDMGIPMMLCDIAQEACMLISRCCAYTGYLCAWGAPYAPGFSAMKTRIFPGRRSPAVMNVDLFRGGTDEEGAENRRAKNGGKGQG